jgi:hypothetical protein
MASDRSWDAVQQRVHDVLQQTFGGSAVVGERSATTEDATEHYKQKQRNIVAILAAADTLSII